MIIFEHLWAFILLPLPLLFRWLTRAYHTQRDALRAPFFQTLVDLTGHNPGKGALVLRRNYAQRIMVVCLWILVVTAMAKPMWLGEPQERTRAARDLMIAIDLSASMETRDFIMSASTEAQPLPRIEGLKLVLTDFITRRQNDRLGLIAFGSAPFLQVPFTQDRELFEFLLNESQTRMAGPKTMLGDAIGLAIKHFESRETSKRTLILITDGNDSGSRVPPLEAADVAADKGITIYTIAIGSPASEGDEAVDLESLREIAKRTDGAAFRAGDGAELQAIYRELDHLAPTEKEILIFRPRRDLFHWPLAAALLFALSLHTLMAMSSAWRFYRQQKLISKGEKS